MSQWKGLASAQSALGAMNVLFLARRGVDGPLRVVEGPFGLDNLLRMRLRVDWDHEGYKGVTTSTIKKYNAMIHTQSAIHAMVGLAAANRPRLDVAAGFDPGTVASIEAEVPQITYDFAGGGRDGSLGEVRTKEQADHDLRYLLAVALLDGNVMPAQFATDRITRPDVQSLLLKAGRNSEFSRIPRHSWRQSLATHDEDWRRALDVQGALWRGGQIRAVGFPDLLVAAVAERERVTVLHYDADYDVIAHVTSSRRNGSCPGE